MSLLKMVPPNDTIAEKTIERTNFTIIQVPR